MKKKIKDLTLGEIIEIAKKYDGNCRKCPFIEIDILTCCTYCDSDEEIKNKIIDEILKEVDLDEN